MSVQTELLKILVCPEDKGPLFYLDAEQVLYNPRLGRTYPIVDDIPVMLLDEATNLDPAAIAALDALVTERGLQTTT